MIKHTTQLLFIIVLVIYHCNGWSQNSASVPDGNHIGTPVSPKFKLGVDITGDIENSINTVTGKVAFSVPLANISSGLASYDLNFDYDGLSAFKNGTELNKHNPVSTIGVGWSLTMPKIVVDNKNTTTREDDEFYYLDDTTSSKLICTERTDTVWTFVMEQFANWKISYHKGFTEFAQHPFTGQWQTVFRNTDFWKIINDEGLEYYFGYADRSQSGVMAPNSISKSKEVVSTWGNWIGDSNRNPTGTSSIVWNISRIRDQWDNQLNFRYDLVEGRQNTSQFSFKHTEASYLKEITSSKGSSIRLNYGVKNASGFIPEYYEPHEERQEPDAYQERYEKKFLQNVEVFNNANQLAKSYALQHSLQVVSFPERKRYLTRITLTSYNNGIAKALPPQRFEYHYSGDFTGGLRKVTYPSGGSITYNYENKQLFYNGSALQNGISGYVHFATKVTDNYTIQAFRSQNTIGSSGKYRFQIRRLLWDGRQWTVDNTFTIPSLIRIDNGFLKYFDAVFEDEFYAFSVAQSSSQVRLHLFHREKDGHTWTHTQYSSIHVGTDGQQSLLSGNKFVAVASHRTGRLATYIWNGKTWYPRSIQQGSGQYYYDATNNFILALDEDGGTDMITGVSHQDNFYMHYLDIENEWQTKSWSQRFDQLTTGINDPSYLYTSSDMAGLVLDNNDEFIMRWSSDYNQFWLHSVGRVSDKKTLLPVGEGMFALLNYRYGNGLINANRFNGVNYASATDGSLNSRKLNFGKNFMTFQDYSSLRLGYMMYDPNTHSFGNATLWTNSGMSPYYPIINPVPWSNLQLFNGIHHPISQGVTTEFVIAGNTMYSKSNTTQSFSWNGSILGNYINDFTYTDGINKAYVRRYTNATSNNAGNFFDAQYIHRQKTGGLIQKSLGRNYNANYGAYTKIEHGITSRANSVFGGNTPFLSSKSMWLKSSATTSNLRGYRFIEGDINAWVRDIVVTSIDMDDDNGNVRKIDYTYNDATPSSDNEIAYYGEVIIENKGFGTSSNGKTKKIYNTGSDDVTMAGLLLEEQFLDTNNSLKAKTTNTWQKVEKSHSIHGIGHDIVLRSERQEIYMPSGNLVNTTNYNYNSDGLITSTSTTNSKGETERKRVRYAYQQYSFVKSKNMLNKPYEIISEVNNETVGVDRSIWVNSSNKVYLKEKWTGPNASNLRMKTDLTRIDTYGVPLEETNGKDVYVSRLLGYSNRYEVAKITNATYQDVINELDVTYSQLQNLNNESLKNELMKLYNRLPDAMITLNFYDDNGRITNTVNERQEEFHSYYNAYGRLDYVTDGGGNILSRETYNYGN